MPPSFNAGHQLSLGLRLLAGTVLVMVATGGQLGLQHFLHVGPVGGLFYLAVLAAALLFGVASGAAAAAAATVAAILFALGVSPNTAVSHTAAGEAARVILIVLVSGSIVAVVGALQRARRRAESETALAREYAGRVEDEVRDRRRAESALEASERRFRSMAETVPVVVFSLTPDGACDFINTRFSEITGVAPDDARRHGWAAAADPHDRDRVAELWSARLRDGAPFEATCRFRTADGGSRAFLVRCDPIRDEAGRTIQWLGACSDIDDLVAADALLVSQARELARSNADLEDFAHAAAHDLKEPLRGIRNYAAFLLEDHGSLLPPNGVDKLRTVDRLAARMHDLLTALMDFALVGRPVSLGRPLDLNPIVGGAIDTLRPRLDGVGVRVIVEPALPSLPCDPALVSQVFTNLVANAVKYNTSPHKVVEIGVAPRPASGGEHHPHAPPVLFVRDNGIGIDPAHHDRVFRLFKRLHAPDAFSGGSGAGLAIVKKIVEGHGGRIWIDSSPGRGSTFFFTLGPGPAALPSAAASAPARPADGAGAAARAPLAGKA